MSFTIRMGIPEMLEFWTELSQKNATGTISKIVPVLHTLQIMPIHTTTPYKRAISAPATPSNQAANPLTCLPIHCFKLLPHNTKTPRIPLF